MQTDDQKEIKDAAERDRKLFGDRQKQQQKNDLKLKLNNCNHEFERFQTELQSKEMKLRGVKSSVEVLKRQSSNFEMEEKKLEQEVNELKTITNAKKREIDGLILKINQLIN